MSGERDRTPQLSGAKTITISGEEEGLAMGMSAGAQWETLGVPKGERYAAWDEKLNDVWGSWSSDLHEANDFEARMTYHSVGGFQVVDCICDPCAAHRTYADVRRDDKELLTVQVVLSGQEHFTIDDKRLILNAGDVLVWNSLKPTSFHVTERLRKISVTMPLTRLRSWLPGSWHSIANNLPHVSPGADLIGSVISSMSPAFFAGTLRNSEALTESIIGLLVNVLEPDGEREPTTLKGAQLALVKTHIENNLADPDMAPATIATAKRISVRYLHALFEGEGKTVQQYVIEQRLIRCRRELENPSMASRTITDIAYSWGFQNSTHFSRRFKSQFGMTPQEFRVAAAVGNRAALV